MDKFTKWSQIIKVDNDHFACFGFESDNNTTGIALFDTELNPLPVMEYNFDRAITQAQAVRGKNGLYLVVSCFPSVEILILKKHKVTGIAKFGPKELDFDWACSMNVLRKSIMIGTEGGRLYQIPLNDL